MKSQVASPDRASIGVSIIQASLAGVNIIAQPDVTLMLDVDAVIRDVTVSNTISGEFVKAWLGLSWIETVDESGAEKVRRSLEDARVGGVSAFRQITQRFPSGLELPIEYTTVRLGDGAGLIAIGRNLQATSELQSRLIAAQQAMERDYWKLREVETRYRLLFDASNEAVLVLHADSLRVVEANPAAIRSLGLTRGWEFINEMSPKEREPFRAMLARVNEQGRAPGGVFHIGAAQAPWILRASLMNDESVPSYMLQLVPVGVAPPMIAAAPERPSLEHLFRSLPDSLAVLDRAGVVRQANQAFLDLVQVRAENAVLGVGLGRWLSAAGADIGGLLADLSRYGKVHATIKGERGAVMDVELSAGDPSGDDLQFIGVILRKLSRKGAAPALIAGPALPALTTTVGKTPLKQLVQSAVAVVERHYVESALRLTEGNRTAAAELLGLSRQSLYAKLNRYGFDGGS